MINPGTRWEDGGSALVSNLECKCGNTIISDAQIFEAGYPSYDKIECSGCGKVWEAKWKGLVFEEVEE